MSTDNKNGENHEEIKLEEEMTEQELAEQAEAEKFILEFEDDDYNDPAKTAELQEKHKILKTTIQQKKHYRTKFQELSEQVGKNANGGTKPPEKKPEQQAPAENKEQDKRLSIHELRLDGYTRDQADEIYNAAENAGMTVAKLMQSPFFQPFIEKLKNKGEVDAASLPPKSRGGGSNAKSDTFDWSTATPAQIKARRDANQGGTSY